MSSISKSLLPRPKLRVTWRICTPGLPQDAQSCSSEVDGNNKELAGRPDFDDRFSVSFVEGDSTDNALDFFCSVVSLTFDDFAREDDVFEVKDRDVVIV